MQALIEGGEGTLNLVRELVEHHHQEDKLAAGAIDRLLAPLPQPAQIRDCLCFEDHVIGVARKSAERLGLTQEEMAKRVDAMLQVMRERPFWYKGNRFAVSGPDDVIQWPRYSSVRDYELEMAAVIGSQCRDVEPQNVESCIFGFTIFNDYTARDIQGIESTGGLGFSKAKDFDGANGLGPCIVTTDEFDFRNARMISRINGEVQCDNSSATMTTSFEDLISFISKDETLFPGELICSGTVGGGCGAEAGRFLESGDEVELEIVGIGVLRQQVRT
jgi:2-keto-4-pentenoate hydratase/2-oxohepta-3-ene-1,7-dioic acid hydratase in catechol pathway